MPFPCQTHLRALWFRFGVCELDHREGNSIDIQIKSQQHPPTYRFKRGQCYRVYSGTSKTGCAMNGVMHCLSNGMWQRRYRLSLTCLPSWITSESGCDEFASWQAKLKQLANPAHYNTRHPTTFFAKCLFALGVMWDDSFSLTVQLFAHKNGFLGKRESDIAKAL